MALVLMALVGSRTAQAQSSDQIPATVDETTITGAAAGVFPGGVQLLGVSLSGLKFGKGVSVYSDGSADGEFEVSLEGGINLGILRIARTIMLEGKAWSGSFDAFGNPTVTGWASLDLGNGLAPLLEVPFVVTFTSLGNDAWTLALTIGQTALAAALITEGGVTVQPVDWTVS